MTDVTTLDRPLKDAMIDGALNRCPNCGEGKILHSYLKVHDHCPNCNEAFHHHRADDGPAYVTILVVGHIAGLFLTLMWEAMRPSPMFMAVSLSLISIVAALAMLPRIKGLIVGYQWAKRMHGFDQE